MPTQPTTNNLEGWEEIEKQLDDLEEDAGDIGHHTIYNGVIRRERINKFISDLRKHDMEELIKIADKGEFEDMRREVTNYYK